MAKAKVSDSMARGLYNLHSGKRVDAHCRGVAHRGAFQGTTKALQVRGLIDDGHQLTEAGRAWLRADGALPLEAR